MTLKSEEIRLAKMLGKLAAEIKQANDRRESEQLICVYNGYGIFRREFHHQLINPSQYPNTSLNLNTITMAGRLFWETFANKWFRPALPLTSLDLTGRTVVVTGSNVGLGLEATKHFYDMNPSRLILAVRSVEKGEAAKNAILKAGKNSKGTKVDVWRLDLNSFESTKAFAKKANDELDRLDVFLANAGISTRQWTTTKDGWESS